MYIPPFQVKLIVTGAVGQAVACLHEWCDVQLPLQIMDLGHHFDDILLTQWGCKPCDEVMPHTKLLYIIVESSMHRL